MIRHDEFSIKGHRVQFSPDGPLWPALGTYLVQVTPDSTRTLRRAVYQFARYFRMEEGYDFVQYGYNGEEDDPTCKAYLFVSPDSHRSGVAFGAACFRTRCDHVGKRWEAMCWVWIHPFNRRRGLLTECLPVFEKLHGDFFPETPWSPAMAHFISKHLPKAHALVHSHS